MKNICTIIAIILIQFVWAQDTNPEKKEMEISFNNLEVPNTPAFILLDEAPTSIQRPNSTRAFALDLIQDVTEDGVLGNLAVEVTPFWMIQHTHMTPEKYYGIKTQEDGSVSQNFFSKLRLASVSAAYMKSADSITNISIGVRTTLFEIKRQDDIKDYKEALLQAQKYLNNSANYMEQYNTQCKIPKPENYRSETAFQEAMLTYKGICDKPEPPRPTVGATDEEIKKYRAAIKEYRLACYCPPDPRDYDTTAQFEAAKEWYEAGLNTFREKKREEDDFTAKDLDVAFKEITSRKPLFAIDLAAAYNQRFFGNTFNDNTAGRFGIWSTLTLSSFLDKKKTNRDYFNVYGFVRYLDDTRRGIFPAANNDRFNAFDLGVKGELEFDKLSVAYEYINRSGDMEGYRSVGTIRYQLINDIFLTGSFGNNFEETNDLVTLFGIKWGINGALQSISIPQSN